MLLFMLLVVAGDVERNPGPLGKEGTVCVYFIHTNLILDASIDIIHVDRSKKLPSGRLLYTVPSRAVYHNNYNTNYYTHVHH